MDMFLDFVLKSSLYGSVAGIIILTIKFILKNQLTPKWRSILWLLLIVKLLIPFGPESNLSIFNEFKPTSSTSNLYSYTVEDNDFKISNKVNESDYIKKLPQNNFKLPKQNIKNSNPKNNLYIFKSFFIIFLEICWIIIFLSLLCFSICSYIYLHFKIYKNKAYPNKRTIDLLEHSKNKLKIRRNIKIIVNSHIITPALTGILKPKILLPSNMTNLSDDELIHIFLHELSHYKRKDNFLNIVLMILQCLHWFNPFIWYLFKKLREDMELATDEKALSVLNTKEYNSYGLTLLTVISKTNKINFQPNLLGMAKNKKDMENRIMNIKLIKKSKSKKLICTTIGVLIFGALSPLILTSAKSNIPVSYALTSKDTVLNNYKLSEFQNTFFDLVKFVDENKNISVEKLRSTIKYFPLVKTEQLGSNDKVDIYEKNNEQIRVYYNKIDGKGPYYARNIEYKLNSKNPNINSITLSNLDISPNKKVVSLQVATESINDLDKTSKILKLDESNANTYTIYLNLLKSIESKDNFISKDLLKFNPNFKKLENSYDKDKTAFEIKANDYESITIVFNKDGEIDSISLSDKRYKKIAKDFITTKTEHTKDTGWDVQKHYKQEYNLTYGKTGHIISVERENPEDAKKLFIDFFKEYN